MRGFLGGVSLGALLAAGGAAVLSLSMPLPQRVEVEAETPAPAVQPETGATLEITPSAGDADLVEAMPAAPETSSAAEDLTPGESADTASAGRPAVSGGTEALPGPADADSAPVIAAGDDDPVRTPAATEAPAQPDSEAGLAVSTEPAAPPAAPEPDAPSQDTAGTAETAGTGQEETADATEQPETPAAPAPQVAVTVPQIDAPSAAETPDVLPEAAVPPVRRPVPGEREEEAAETGPQIGTPVVPFTERDDAGEDAASAAQTVSPALLTPFEAFSEEFTNPEGRPLMSIVLIDDAKSIGAEALTGFPYPLSFAIDPESPDAAGKMAARRAAGFEVLILADLPRAAKPQDAETALAVWGETLPEAIGVLEGTDSGVQGSRALADQVAAVAAAKGMGLVMQNSGLNTVQKLAARDGVPSGVVFRDFDGAGQDPRAIRRFLDQAAFRAGQEGAVIMLGRVRPDTISALLLWGLQDRASRVSLAPVSASLKARLAEGG